MKRMWERVLGYMLVLAISVSEADVLVYAQEGMEIIAEETMVNTSAEELLQGVETVSGNEAVVSVAESQSSGWDGVTTQQIYEGENYRIYLCWMDIGMVDTMQKSKSRI